MKLVIIGLVLDWTMIVTVGLGNNVGTKKKYWQMWPLDGRTKVTPGGSSQEHNLLKNDTQCSFI